MDEKDFRQLSDSEFKAALIATLNLKKEWMASVDKREKELGIRLDFRLTTLTAGRPTGSSSAPEDTLFLK